MLATQTLPQRRPKTMRVAFEGELPPGVTAKDVDARRDRADRRRRRRRPRDRVRRRRSIRGLSMEGRMTICNMSIEAGARAGMIAPDETTFAYLEGRPGAPSGAAWERALDDWRALASDDDAVFDREVEIDAGELTPQVTWGTNPGMVAPVDGRRPGSGGARRPGRPRRSRARARLHGARARHADRGDRRSTASSSARARTRASRTCGSPRRSSTGGRCTRRCARWSCPGSAAVRRQAEDEGPRRRLPAGRVRVAARGLLDVPRHEPRRARARRALRVDLEPQLRGSPGTRRAHAPRQPGDGGGRCGRGAIRRRPGARVKPVTRVSGRVAVLDRADVDTDQIIPKQFLKRIERTGYGEFLFYDWRQDPDVRAQPARVRGRTDPAHRPELRRAAPRASTQRGRCRTTASTQSSRPRSATSSRATRPRSAC